MLRYFRGQHGQQMIVFALLMPILLVFMGLVVDIGNVYVHRRMAQNAADAAASAAGMVLYSQGTSVARATAFYYAGQHGYNNNGTTNTVTVSTPPTSGAFAGNSRYIQVQIEERVDPFFVSLLWSGEFRVRASATAGYNVRQLGADILVLKDTLTSPCPATTSMNGNTGVIFAMGGTVHINSPCAGALSLGNGDIYANEINIVGGYTKGPNGILAPPPRTGAAPIPDPLASLPAPNPSTCPTRSGPVNGKYLPGVYPANFKPNFDYVFDGSSGECNGVFYMNATLDATGGYTVRVNRGMFYFANGGLILGGNSDMMGSAPTSGPYAGVLVFMARNNTSTFDMHGTPQVGGCNFSSAALKGIIYLPKGHLNVIGTSDMCISSALIAWTFEANGNGTLTAVEYQGTRPGATVTDGQVE